MVLQQVSFVMEYWSKQLMDNAQEAILEPECCLLLLIPRARYW
jgi:hypothetical protein